MVYCPLWKRWQWCGDFDTILKYYNVKSKNSNTAIKIGNVSEQGRNSRRCRAALQISLSTGGISHFIQEIKIKNLILEISLSTGRISHFIQEIKILSIEKIQFLFFYIVFTRSMHHIKKGAQKIRTIFFYCRFLSLHQCTLRVHSGTRRGLCTLRIYVFLRERNSTSSLPQKSKCFLLRKSSSFFFLHTK